MYFKIELFACVVTNKDVRISNAKYFARSFVTSTDLLIKSHI